MAAPSPHKPPFLPSHPVRWNDYKIAGLDEAGRGCLAGPVVAAAVILNPLVEIKGLADSKAISSSKREKLAVEIKNSASAWSIGLCWQKRIDEINILQATFEAMAKAIRSLKIQPDILLIDGPHPIPEKIIRRFTSQSPIQRAITGGDRAIDSISAASILAKTFRDRLMRSFARKWPAYGFERHKGYGTNTHLEVLRRLGPCPLHRLTFKRVLPEVAHPQLCPFEKLN